MDIKNLKNDKLVVDFTLFKYFCIYDLFNPHGSKVFGWNFLQLFLVVFSVISSVVFGYATIGFFTKLEDKITEVEIVLTTTIHMELIVCLLKVTVYVHYSDKVWSLFSVFRVDFLMSDLCCKHYGILNKARVKSTRIIFIYTFIGLTLIQQWATFPYTYKMFFDSEGPNHRSMNIYNLRFPVSLDMYNEYYMMFYILEFLMAIYLSIVFFLNDMVLMSFCWIMIVQHDVLAQSFQEVGHGKNQQTEEDYKQLKSILFDQQQLFLKLKLFQTFAKPILFAFITINSAVIILDSYTFVLICTSEEAVSILATLKVAFTLGYVFFKLFIYCYSFDELNIKRESVTFGIYSCEWTKMDLNFRKTVLLAMRMNDVNQLAIQFSPTKVVNVQMCSGIMSMSFNMVSVLLKTMRNKSGPYAE